LEDNIKIKIKLNIRWKSVEWIHVCHDRDTVTAGVNTVVKFWIPQMAEICWLEELLLLASREGII